MRGLGTLNVSQTSDFSMTFTQLVWNWNLHHLDSELYILYTISFFNLFICCWTLRWFHMLTIVINASMNHIDLFHLLEILQGRAGTSPSLQTRSRKGDSIWRRRNIGSRLCLSYISTSPTGEAVCFALQIVVPGLHFFSFTS